ncbi:MAG: 1-deoxy-D-xylulose-5-phosphate synthase [Clostridia bacterium]|nr:1-deoxy-D-xylulose-5-phosphate synthase [Clostridia bacterium]
MNVPTTTQLKTMSIPELKELAHFLREQIISVVKINGGHLASNLGVVELTIALHYVFDTPYDKLIFDVGHQCYAHKLLTGRADNFIKLRMADGISGFPKQSESEFDTFDTGHAGTAISLASGLMRARNLNCENYNIISLVGDGSFRTGQTQEALNDLGTISGNHILLLNDNNMTISKSAGAISFNDELLKNLFNSLNINYVGSVDGHDLEALISCFTKIKNENKQFAIRILTEKGKGYKEAEECPDKFHAVARVSDGEISGDYAAAFGEKLTELAAEDSKIVAVSAAMTDSVGLRNFSNEFPYRMFDVGICEPHAISMAVGLANGGMKPYVSIYSSFLQRSFDQILNDICLTSQNVTIAVDHSGFVDGDGETHQGFYDISFLSLMPNMTIVAPRCTEELKRVLEWSVNFNAPLAIRYPKAIVKTCNSKCKLTRKFDNIENEDTIFGQWSEKSPEEDFIILTTGALCFSLAKEVKRIFAEKGINIAVQNALFVKPIDENYLLKLDGKSVITIEDNVEKGGFGSMVADFFEKKCLHTKHFSISIDNPVLKQGSLNELIEISGFTPNAIVRKIENFFNRE